MRIIHTSDWHLGQYFYGKSRAKEHQQFLNWLLTQVDTKKVDAIIVAGDIFDTATPPSYAREMYFDFIAKLQLKQCQLIILAGNHDSVAMLSESQSVLASLNTQVIAQAQTVIESISDEGLSRSNAPNNNNSNQQVMPLYDASNQVSAMLCAIPFIRPRDIIKSKAGQSAKDKQQNLQQAISKHYQTLYKEAKLQAEAYEKAQGAAIPVIATGHLTALGVSLNDSKSDSVRDIYIGSLEAFPANEFPPADYIALGHIHRAQKIAKSEHIRYCGSPIPLSFDEAKQDKRVLMVDFSAGKLSQVTDLIIPCFQALYMVKASLDTLHSALQETMEHFTRNQDPLSEDANTEIAWLDIEIDNAEHLSDLTQRVTELVTDMPVEILLVRRSKKARQRQLLNTTAFDNSNLNELTINEVFDSRLSQLDWETDEELARQQRLKQLFSQVSSELAQTPEDNVDEIETTPTLNEEADE